MTSWYAMAANAERTGATLAAGRLAAEASARSRNVEEQLRSYERRIEFLSLICRAMWSFIEAEKGMTLADLQHRIDDLDQLDGKTDNRLRYEPTKCQQCGNTYHRKHYHCLYCGALRPEGDLTPFDRV
ncbi:MAG: hypothetical protein L0Z55_09790 [Planctomycetes bacterium]|nr:hypothetical protein [Planctomycetota bacterium]